MIGVLGMGSVGSLIAMSQIQEQRQVAGLDFRLPEPTVLTVHLIFEGITHIFETKMLSSVPDEVQLVFVTCKSTQLNSTTLEALRRTQIPKVFLQNGISTYLKYQAEPNFYFGNVSGFEAKQSLSFHHISLFNARVNVSLNESLFASIATKDSFPLDFCNYNHALEPIVRKYGRWFISSGLMITEGATLGVSRQSVDVNVFRNACLEIQSVLKLIGGCPQSPEDLMAEVMSLPSPLTTSSYRDFVNGRKTEWEAELELAINFLTSNGLNCPILLSWRDRIGEVRGHHSVNSGS